jgi:predicted RNA-binding Zn-ribbon protein involved in translation (DUF1610 family)
MVSMLERHKLKVGQVGLTVSENGMIQPTIRPIAGLEVPARPSTISFQSKGRPTPVQSAVTLPRHHKCPQCGRDARPTGNQWTCPNCGHSTSES